MTIETAELRPGYRIARLIKGGWHLAGGHGPIDTGAAIADMAAYVDAGLTTFDCADIYTGVEEMIGAFRRTLPEAARERLKVHTKFVPDLDILQTITREHVTRIIERSLQRLGQERLDLVQFHWWDYAVANSVRTAQWLGELQDAGKIELIGGTNFDAEHTAALIGAGVKLASMQVQYSLLDDRPSRKLSDVCARHGMKLLCYGTVAGGFLSERWLGAAEPREPLGNRSLTKYKLVIEDVGGWDWFQALLRVLARIGAKHGRSISSVASRYVLGLPHVAAVIVGVRSRAHLAEHFRLFDFSLDAADLSDIGAVLAQRRALPGDVYTLERDRDGRHGRIMKYNLADA
jgi:aryl-alcohol dehydrogenase-like predicted oxidoreductase